MRTPLISSMSAILLNLGVDITYLITTLEIKVSPLVVSIAETKHRAFIRLVRDHFNACSRFRPSV